MTLGCGVITRNTEIALLDKALASVVNSVDHIYITVADKEEPTEEMKALAAKYKADLSYFHWIKDFSAARNFNMRQCKDDWYVWLDSDDEVEGMEKAKEKLERIAPNIKYVLCTYNYMFSPTGEVIVRHPKERFIRNNGEFEWKGRLHETCVSDHQTDGQKWDDIVWNHRASGQRSKESSKRNVEIIKQEIEETGGLEKCDPRALLNLGMALMGVDEWELAIKAFYEYLQRGKWEEHQWMAWKQIAFAQMKIGRPELAVRSLLQCLELRPGYVETYSLLGSAYKTLKNNDRAKEWFTLALAKPSGENPYASDVMISRVEPLVSLAVISAEEGKIDDALTFLKEVKKYTTDDYIVNLEKLLLAQKADMDQSLELVKKLEGLPEEEQKTVFDALEPKWKAMPRLVAFRVKKQWKKETNGKEVVIFTGRSWEEWTPESEKTGIGGSEEAVINMGRELKKLGYDVTVYGTHGTEGKEYDGVWYKPFWEFVYTEACDIFIGWRDPGIFEFPINAKKKYLWLHDTIPASSITPDRLKGIDKVMVLSKYHRSLYPNVPEEKIFLTGNGINPEHFSLSVERNPHKVIYASAPNRGLHCLLKMWPKIKEQVPDAELYWAYGWNTYDKMLSGDPKAQQYKREVCELLKQPGVTDLGRIGHEELAKHMLSSGVWCYPTEFTEIYCITAVKMQAAGAIPVCTTVAALDEMVQFGTKLNVSDLYTNEQAQEEYIQKVVEALNSTQDRSEMQTWAMETKSWVSTAKQWAKEFSV